MAVIEKWELQSKVRAMTTDNVADIVPVMSLLHQTLPNPFHLNLKYFHLRCIEHVIKIAVKNFLSLIRKYKDAIRSLVTSIRCSVKLRNTFQKVVVELGETEVVLPGLYVDTRWSSTYMMITNAFGAQNVLNGAVHRTP